jgi:hypothetical protein
VHGAHICCTDLAAAAFVIEGAQVAHEVSRQSVALAVTAPGDRATRQAVNAVDAVNAASLLAQANAVRTAVMRNRSAMLALSDAPMATATATSTSTPTLAGALVPGAVARLGRQFSSRPSMSSLNRDW